MSGEILELYTEFEDVVELAAGLTDRVEPGRLILYGPEGYEAGTVISYALYLANGSPGLMGSGIVAGSVDGGDERHESARFDVVIDQLSMDAEFESTFVTMLAELGFDADAGGDDRVLDATSPDSDDDDDDSRPSHGAFSAQPFGQASAAPFEDVSDWSASGAAARPVDDAESGDPSLSPEIGEWSTPEYELNEVLRAADPGDATRRAGSVNVLSEPAGAALPESEAPHDPEGYASEEAAAETSNAAAVEAADDFDAPTWGEEASPSARPALVASDAAGPAQSERPLRSEPPSLPASVPPARSGSLRAGRQGKSARGTATGAGQATTAGPLTRPILAESWSLSAPPLEKLPAAGPFFDYPNGELPLEASPPRPEGFQHVQVSPAPHPDHAHQEGYGDAPIDPRARAADVTADIEPLDWSEEESVSRSAYRDDHERVSDYPTPM